MTLAAGRAATRLLQALALALAASTLVAALHDVSAAWDVWYYHLPFAARIGGILPADAYTFHAANQARFAGFPLLGEAMEGLLWRLTGQPQAANLVAFGSVALYALWLRRALGVPLHLTAIALFAIPLVQLHATSCYVDLPANLCVSALILSVFQLWAAKDPPPLAVPWRLLVPAAIAANMRFQLQPVIAVALLAAAPRVLPPLVRGQGASRRIALTTLLVLAVGATLLKNAAVHHNPYYPMKIEVAGLVLPGPEGVYHAAPPYLRDAPRAQRWLYSVLEVGIRPLSERRRWTIDQWMPEGSTGCRMGGFFGAYVVLHVALLAWRAARDRARAVRAPALGFALLTAVAASLPQCHELRYYMFWMIVLVSLNLALACAPGRPEGGRLALGAACLAALGVVLAVTRCGYVYASGSTFAETVRERVDAAVLAQIHEGEKVCLSREPWTMLYASPFHPPARYAVREAELAEDCEEYRWIAP
jgi:hypothetical protein